MDYSNCENCTMLVDKSGWQPLTFMMHAASLDVHGFLLENKIKMTITETAVHAGEFTYQAYDQNLFSGDHVVDSSTVALGRSSINDYVMSSTDGVLTTANIDNNGYKVDVLNEQRFEENSCLWETSKYWQELSVPDKSVVYAARYLTSHNERFFILVNDKNLVDQLCLEGFQCLRGAAFLSWMVKRDSISYQKGTHIYGRWRVHDQRWVKKDTSFGNILQKF